ncbi:MAG: ribosome silencing factor [Phycisphaerae bacterium]
MRNRCKLPDATRPAQTADDALEFARQVARIAAAHKIDDVAVLNLRGLSGLTDFFVIGTGTSERQMSAVLDRIAAHAHSVQRRPFNVTDTREARWALADYVDVVVHLFDAYHREYYDLDGLWGDAPRVAWQAGRSDNTDEPAG